MPPAPRDSAAAPARTDDLAHTIRELLARDAHGDLASELARRPWQELHGLGIAGLRALFGILPRAAVDEAPWLLISAARAAEAAVELEWRSELLAWALATARVRGDTSLELRVLAELAADAAIDGDIDLALERSGQVLAVLPGSGDVRARATRGRAALARGRALAFRRAPGERTEVTRVLAEAAFLLGAAREPELEAMALTILGYSVQFAEGDLESAVETLRTATEVEGVEEQQRAANLTFLADALLYLGRFEEARAALASVSEIARRRDDPRLRAYHAWMEAGLASRRGDRPGTEAWLAEVERHPGDWSEHPTGIEFLADAADHLGRLGDEEGARRYLDRVEERVGADPHPEVADIALAANAVFGGRFGDPGRAERDLVAFGSSPQLPPRERWRVALLRAAAAARAADSSAASRHLAAALSMAAALGHPDLPRQHEPLLVDALAAVPGMATSGLTSGSRAGAPPAPSWRITLLGGFSTTFAGRNAPPPAGRPAALVKLLAVRRNTLAAEEVIELLWPETDEEVGRARLRNVLSRIRSACGALVVRTDGGLRLPTDASIDADQFERSAKAALTVARRSPTEGEPLVRQALARYAGELLPEDRFEEFTAAPRELLAQLRLDLLDRLAASAVERDDVDEALRALDEAIEASPLDEHRFERAAELALASGRRQRAAAYVSRGMAVTGELGIEPSATLVRLGARIGPAR